MKRSSASTASRARAASPISWRSDYGLTLPRKLQIEFSQIVQEIADKTGKEISSEVIWRPSTTSISSLEEPYAFIDQQTLTDTHASEIRNLTAKLRENGGEVEITGRGNGPIDAFMDAMKKHSGIDLKVVDYREHSVGMGNDADAVAYLEIAVERRPHGVRCRHEPEHRHRQPQGRGLGRQPGEARRGPRHGRRGE